MEHNAFRAPSSRTVLETINLDQKIAVNSGHVECLNIVFNMTDLQCSDRSQSFPKLPDYLIYIKHCVPFLCVALYNTRSPVSYCSR